MSSTRLPNKVLMPILEQPLLLRMVQRVRKSKLCGTIVVATTTDAIDNSILNLCKANHIECLAGHPTDLLDRHFQVAKKYDADVVLKIPSDCPLIDATIIDQTIQYFLDNQDKFDFVSNLHPATHPDGNDVEVMSFSTLEKAWKEATRPLEREHTTPYIWENPELFRIGNFVWETGLDYSKSHRWTIDYIEDYAFIKKVYEELYPINPDFGLTDILNLVEKHREIYDINAKYAGDYWYYRLKEGEELRFKTGKIDSTF
jgi:spore coat polysaccharide biosynthesis protein SpsF